jgi:hypothetical protein
LASRWRSYFLSQNQPSSVIGHGQAMDSADIINNLIDIGKKEDFENRVDIIARMKEMEITIGPAKNEPFTGR